MSKTSKWGKAKATVEQPVVEETREEKINKIVEAEAEIFDAEEEKFLNSTECVCECTRNECVCDTSLPRETPFVPEAPKTKSFAQMTATEVNIYHKTGILPLL